MGTLEIDNSTGTSKVQCIVVTSTIPRAKEKSKMKQTHLQFKSEFRIALDSSESQFAEMVLPPRGTEGGPDNRHRGADQWLFVVSGRGVAIVSGQTHKLTKGSLLLIQRGETHEIRNTGSTPLRTLNAYSPRAYTPSGNPLFAGKP